MGPGDNRLFILPEEWAVNRFLPLMNDKVFKELCTRYQIPEHIPIRLPRETRDVTRGEPSTLACTTPCLLRGLDCR